MDTSIDNSIDQRFIEFVVKSLVGNPDAVVVERRIDEKGVLLELTVDPEDLGRVIGKRGATAQSLRTLLRALGTKNDARYNLKIVDNGEPRPERNATVNDDSFAHDDGADSHGMNTQDTPVPVDDATTDDAVSAIADDLVDDGIVDEDHEFVTKGEDNHQEATESSSDRINKTRRELEELDDLDV